MASRRGSSLGVLLFALGIAVTAAAWGVNEWAVDRLLRQTAVDSSESAAEYFAKNIPGIDAVLAGKAITPQAGAFISTAVSAKGIDAFKLYSPSGHLILDTRQLTASNPESEQLGAHNPEALAILSANQSFAKLEEEVEDGTTELKAETYVPIEVDGKLAGVAEVYIDLTATAANVRRSFFWSSGLIAAIVGLGFIFPAVGYLRRNRQKIVAEEHVRFLANHDLLTGLPNRDCFTAELQARLAAPANASEMVAVHFINLDGFRDLNEQHGHEFGNEVLRAVAGRLRAGVRATDLVSRIAADEFVIVQTGLSDHVELAELTARLSQLFGKNVGIRQHQLKLTASIGTAVALVAGSDAEQLIDNADIASTDVKSRGGNGHRFFEEQLNAARRLRNELEALLRQAVEQQSFELHFQPLFNFRGHKLKGFEALLRLKDTDGSYVPPDRFIPVAEELGLIDEIGAWVLLTACTTATSWPDDLQISVNLSALQFKRRAVVPATRKALAMSGLPPRRLLLEITESTLLSDTEAIIDQLRELKAIGTSIVMDDFGTGYSSLGYMLRFPFDHIKIDRSFVKAIGVGSDNATTVIETIIALGHTLKMNVTAEGVETETQAATLRDLRCDDAQGYLFGKPMPASEVSVLLLRYMAAQSRPAAGPALAASEAAG